MVDTIIRKKKNKTKPDGKIENVIGVDFGRPKEH